MRKTFVDGNDTNTAEPTGGFALVAIGRAYVPRRGMHGAILVPALLAVEVILRAVLGTPSIYVVLGAKAAT